MPEKKSIGESLRGRALVGRVLENESGGSETGLNVLAQHLWRYTSFNLYEIIGIVRAVRYAVSHADERDMQLYVGKMNLGELENLVEISGRRFAETRDKSQGIS